MPSITLANAFKQPFGPWREDLVLSQKWQTKKGEILTLDNVLLTQGTAAVGLDSCSFLPPADGSNEPTPTSADPVHFMGVFTVEQPFARLLDKNGTRKDLLSDTGWDLIAKQYGGNTRDRWMDSHLRGNERVLRIKIVGQVSMSVRYLEADDKYVPNGLKMVSQYTFGDRTKKRVFHIRSLHPRTYELSRTYLARCKFLRELREIIGRDRSRTKQEDRDLDWFMQKYVSSNQHNPRALVTRRVLFDQDDRDLKKHDPASTKRLPDGTLRRGKKRIPKFVASAEVRSYFAVFAPWIANQAKQTHIRRLNMNMSAWAEQTNMLIRTRAIARMAPEISFFGEDWTGPGDQDQQEETFLIKYPELSQPKRSQVIPRAARRRVSLSPEVSPEPGPAHSSSPEGSEMDYSDNDERYSDPDTEPDTFSDEEEAEVLSRDDVALLQVVPRWGLEMPFLDDDRLWWCPQRDCGHTIDLWALQQDERALLSKHEPIRRLLEKGLFRPSDPWVQNVLRLVVDAHYDEHLEKEFNVRKTCIVKPTGVHVSFEWINVA